MDAVVKSWQQERLNKDKRQRTEEVGTMVEWT